MCKWSNWSIGDGVDWTILINAPLGTGLMDNLKWSTNPVPKRPLDATKKTPSTKESVLFSANDGNRTRDLLTTNEVRYRLCHVSIFACLRLV